MKLGAFSISLSVKDLKKSKTFYEKLGFSQIAGELDHNYLILKNESTTIGLFQGMFDKNILTFNPGWDQDCNELSDFEDVRQIQKQLLADGIELTEQVDDSTKGIGSIALIDPDGNPILIDQHVSGE